MNNLDEISRLLGNIETSISFMDNRLGSLVIQVEDSRKEQAKLLATLQELSDRIGQLEEDIEKDIEPTVKYVQQLQQRGAGILATIGFVSVGVGFALNKSLKYFFNI